MEFANKEYLFLLLLLIPYIVWYLMYRRKSEPTIRMSDTNVYRYASRSWKVTLMPLQPLLRMAVFTLVVLVLARPQTQNSWKNKEVEGIDTWPVPYLCLSVGLSAAHNIWVILA